ncbi:MAG: class I SAM-dependent methyltransferase [Nitrosomonas sp.]|nr:MAG: class I SAM-dependent methyltransferase [Nitrosomonas sp.]
MGFTLDKVVPWGRSYDEYVSMFNLTEKDLSLRILGCGDGPAAFNTVLTKRGGSVVSVDPVYVFDTTRIRSRIAETYETVMIQMHKNQGDYVWKDIPSVEQLGRIRMSAMEDFLADFDSGKQQGRYIAGELPSLPFGNEQFDIALSSHFLFLYSAHLSTEFHLRALQEMLRVSCEVRVFPLLTLGGASSPYLHTMNEYFVEKGFGVDVMCVPYEFQRGGNEMLVIKPV